MVEIKAVVVSPTCPFCRELQDYLKEKGLLDKVKIIDTETEEGYKFAKDNKIEGVPECIVVEADGKKARVCSKEEFDKLIEEGK